MPAQMDKAGRSLTRKSRNLAAIVLGPDHASPKYSDIAARRFVPVYLAPNSRIRPCKPSERHKAISTGHRRSCSLQLLT